MAEYLNCKQRATDRANNRVNSIPGRVHPRNFIGEKFEEIENARDRNDPRISEHFERLIGRRERDPVEMNGEASGENRQIKVDAGEASKAERDRKKIQLFHARNIRAAESLSREELRTLRQMTKHEWRMTKEL